MFKSLRIALTDALFCLLSRSFGCTVDFCNVLSYSRDRVEIPRAAHALHFVNSFDTNTKIKIEFNDGRLIRNNLHNAFYESGLKISSLTNLTDSPARRFTILVRVK